MADMSRPVPGAQPAPDPTASPSSSGPVCAERVVPARSSADRRRSHVPSTPSTSEADRRCADEHILIELRRKVQSGELLSASTERLLWKMRFNGHLTIVVQNGRVLKTGYEEGYFRRRNDLGGFLIDA